MGGPAAGASSVSSCCVWMGEGNRKRCDQQPQDAWGNVCGLRAHALRGMYVCACICVQGGALFMRAGMGEGNRKRCDQQPQDAWGDTHGFASATRRSSSEAHDRVAFIALATLGHLETSAFLVIV